jgi:hypothetical protein
LLVEWNLFRGFWVVGIKIASGYDTSFFHDNAERLPNTNIRESANACHTKSLVAKNIWSLGTYTRPVAVIWLGKARVCICEAKDLKSLEESWKGNLKVRWVGGEIGTAVLYWGLRSVLKGCEKGLVEEGSP